MFYFIFIFEFGKEGNIFGDWMVECVLVRIKSRLVNG